MLKFMHPPYDDRGAAGQTRKIPLKYLCILRKSIPQINNRSDNLDK